MTDEEHLRPKNDRVHWRVFKPKATDKELSIARIDQLATADVWELGDSLVAGPSKRTVYGRADFDLSQVRSVRVNGDSLDAISDDPPMRHAIIVGWPDDSNARKVAAMQLTANSVRHIR